MRFRCCHDIQRVSNAVRNYNPFANVLSDAYPFPNALSYV